MRVRCSEFIQQVTVGQPPSPSLLPWLLFCRCGVPVDHNGAAAASKFDAGLQHRDVAAKGEWRQEPPFLDVDESGPAQASSARAAMTTSSKVSITRFRRVADLDQISAPDANDLRRG